VGCRSLKCVIAASHLLQVREGLSELPKFERSLKSLDAMAVTCRENRCRQSHVRLGAIMVWIDHPTRQYQPAGAVAALVIVGWLVVLAIAFLSAR
jgi:hypothetical protein